MLDHFGKYILRTPLFTYQNLIDDPEDDLPGQLLRKLDDPVFLEAIYWASPFLFQLIGKFKEGKLQGDKKAKLFQSLEKYLIRASSRSTPYGLFAGCSVSLIAKSRSTLEQALENDFHSQRREVRVDMGLITKLTGRIQSDPNILPHLKYFPNSSLYRLGDNFRFIEYTDENDHRDYQLIGLTCTPLLMTIFDKAQKGITFKELDVLMTGEGNAAERAEFADELIISQFLVSEIELSITGERQLEELTQVLLEISEKSPAVLPYLDLIDLLQSSISTFAESATGVLPFQKISQISEMLTLLGIEITDQFFHQADLVKNSSYQGVSEETVRQVIEGLDVLGRLSQATSTHEKDLASFIDIFLEKYDTAAIPLSEVMDAEFGVGFPVMDSIGNVSEENFLLHEADSPAEPNEPQLLLQGKDDAGKCREQRFVEINDKDLAGLKPVIAELPPTFAAIFSVLPGGKILLQHAGGASARTLLGRFTYLDTEMQSLFDEVVKKENEFYQDCIIAEIVHLPEGRTGNVLRRLVNSTHEIPYLAGSSLEGDFRIGINDILVSVQHNTIILSSRKLGKRIIPRLSTAHNYNQSKLAVYRFLAALQHQSRTGIGIHPAYLSANKKSLPRITYKNIILQPATWFFYPDDYQAVTIAGDPLKELLLFVKHWELPRFIAVSRGDNELFIDIETPACQLILLDEFKKKQTLKLIEWLHFDETADQAYVTQVVLPLYQTSLSPDLKSKMAVTELQKAAVQRMFIPGSEWIYFKLYCGAHLSDQIISDLGKLLTRMQAEQLIDHFFFIRYADPHYHLRVRMNVPNISDHTYGLIMRSFQQAISNAVAERSIWKVQLDSYSRELERYGMSCMEISELIFSADTKFILSVLGNEELVAGENWKMLAAVQNIDSWLDIFELDIAAKLAFASKMQIYFTDEFGIEMKIEHDRHFRADKGSLNTVFSENRFSVYNEERALEIRRYIRESGLSLSFLRRNLESYIHMSVNRWFKTDHRLYEYRCYLYLEKYYLTTIKKKNLLID